MTIQWLSFVFQGHLLFTAVYVYLCKYCKLFLVIYIVLFIKGMWNMRDCAIYILEMDLYSSTTLIIGGLCF